MRPEQRAPALGRSSSSAAPPAISASATRGDRDERRRHRPQQPRQARGAEQREDHAARDRRRQPRPARLGRDRTSASSAARRRRRARAAPAPGRARAAVRDQRPRATRGRPRAAARGRGCSRGRAPTTAAMTAALPVRPATKPLQPATSSTDRRPAISPGTTSRQPPGVRPSPRGGRSTMRAETKTTSPRRFCAAAERGPDACPRPARAARGRRARRAGRARPPTARRSPGSSSPQPPRLAKWTVSEAAARTAASSASSSAGARGSSTTSGRESASEISLRSISPAPRATLGQWMREAGEPSRCSRRPSISVSACAISAARACAEMPVAAAGGGADRRTRAGARAPRRSASPRTTRSASPNGSRRTSAGGASTRRPRRAKVTSTRTRARAAARLQPHRLGEQRLVDPAGRQREPAAAGLDAQRQRLLLQHAAPAELAADASRPTRRARSTRRSRAPSRISAAPVTYSGSASNVPATSSSASPSAAQPRAERTAGRLERRRPGEGGGDDLLARHAGGLGDEHDAVRQHGWARAPGRRRAARGRGR